MKNKTPLRLIGGGILRVYMQPTASATPDEQNKDPWVAPILSIAQLVSWGAMFYAFAIVLDPMSAELGASRTELSATYGLGLLVSGLAAWPVGVLIDRGFTRELMTLGSLLGALGLVIHGLADSLADLYIAWLVIGLSMACTLYEPVFSAMVRAYPHSYRSRITVITLLGGLASTAFWPLTAALTHAWGWRDALIVLGAMQVAICAPIHWFFVPPTHPTVQAATSKVRQSSLSLVRSRLFLLLALSSAAHLFYMAAVAGLLVAMLDGLSLQHSMTLLVVACIGPMQVAGRLALLVSEKRWSSQAMTRLILWLPAAGLLMFLLLSLLDAPAWVALAFVGAALYGAGNGMLTIVRGTAVADMVGPARVATLNGIISVPAAFSRAAGPFVIAAFWEFTGSIAVALAALLLIAAASAVTFFAAIRASHPKAHQHGPV